LWFARDEQAPGTPLLVPKRWPRCAAASISTHDLPTAVGFLRGEHVRARAELGLLKDEAAEWAQARTDRAELIELLRSAGLLQTDDEDEIVVAMHALLGRTPCQLQLVSPYDVVGETRQPNLPGTVDEYPNWRLPLPVTLEELKRDPRVTRVVAALRSAGSTTGASVRP
jgi:4-alpha-glucanotransferase